MDARYNNNKIMPLSDRDLAKKAPSIFAESGSPLTSRKYVFIPTIHVIHAMRDEGFMPVAASEARSRISENEGFTKHVVRFRKEGLTLSKVGEVVPEIILANSHNGKGNWKLDAGCTRLVCTNGLIVSDATLGSVTVRHRGNRDTIIDDVIEGTYEILSHSDDIAGKVEAFMATPVARNEQMLLAKAALKIRWPYQQAPIQAEQLLMTRRTTDNQKTLWHTYNVIQENLIRGGIAGKTASGKNTSTRAINSVTVDYDVNKGLWRVTNELADLLG